MSITANESLLLGMVGGFLDVLIQMPLITLKICRQDGRKLPTNINNWYRGVGVNLISIAPITSLQFYLSDSLETKINKSKSFQNKTIDKIIASSIAGGISSLLYSPVELIMIQQQKQNSSFYNTNINIYKNYGINKFMRGLSPCIAREAIYTSGYMAFSPIIEQKLSDHSLSKSKYVDKISSCIITGSIVSFITHPIDTVKTKIQSDITKQKYKKNFVSEIYNIYKKEGINNIYKGGVSRTARACGAFFIFNIVRDSYLKIKENGIQN